MKTIAVDFDGVIHKYSQGWQGGKIYDPPVEGAFESLNKLIHEGYEVVIYTTREDHQAIREWIAMHTRDTPYVNLKTIGISSEKPKAIAYIDDRAIRFTNWEDVRKYFS